MPAWESEFPNLGKWIKSSERTDRYNCAAFAAGEDHHKWDPFPPGLHYWPPGVERSYFTPKFIEAYGTKGYEACADGSLEAGWEKIVLYTNAYGGVLHVARQLPDGAWTSKMGNEEDIIHGSPSNLGGGGYGQPTQFMRRPAKNEDKVEDKKEEQQSTQPDSSSSGAEGAKKGIPRASAENFMHREDFTSLVNAAAQKQQPDD